MADGAIRDPYAVLGVTREATNAQLASAHRRLAKSHHPDVNPNGRGAAARMREINDAWQLVSTPTRRAAWDRDHPVAGATAVTTGHWEGQRATVRSPFATSVPTWVAPRAAAAEAESVARMRRRQKARGTRPIVAEPEPEPATFLDSGWAAVLVGVGAIIFLAVAIVAGKLV